MATFDADGLNRVSGRSTGGLVTGIIGSALGLMNGGLGNIGGILGNNGCGCVNNINNLKDEKIDSLMTDLARERSERYTDRCICELKSDMYNKFDAVNSTLNGLALVNNTTANTLSCLTNTVNSLSSAFNAVTITGISSAKVLSSSSTTTTT